MKSTTTPSSDSYIGAGNKKDFGNIKKSRDSPHQYISCSSLDDTDLTFFFSRIALTGKGDKGKNCRDIFPKYNCQSCLKTHFGISQCLQQLCPYCYKAWMVRTTAKIAERLTSWRNRIRNARKRLAHVILSPDPERIWKFLALVGKDKGLTLTDLVQTLRKEALTYLTAKSNTIPSGVLIFHPCRPNERYYAERGEERREEEERPTKELKKWEWILQKHYWYNYVEFSPHFHFVGYIGWLDKPKEGEKFVYKLIPNKNGKYSGINEKNEIYRLIYYLLSHAGKERESEADAYTWIGNMAYRYGKQSCPSKRRKKLKEVKCKLCGGALNHFYPTLRAFFKVWLGIDLKEWIGFTIELKKVVLFAKLPKNIKINVLEALDIYQTGKPPPDYEKFLIR